MQIKELYVSQRKLRNVDQLQQMIETIETEAVSYTHLTLPTKA